MGNLFLRVYNRAEMDGLISQCSQSCTAADLRHFAHFLSFQLHNESRKDANDNTNESKREEESEIRWENLGCQPHN